MGKKCMHFNNNRSSIFRRNLFRIEGNTVGIRTAQKKNNKKINNYENIKRHFGKVQSNQAIICQEKIPK